MALTIPGGLNFNASAALPGIGGGLAGLNSAYQTAYGNAANLNKQVYGNTLAGFQSVLANQQAEQQRLQGGYGSLFGSALGLLGAYPQNPFGGGTAAPAQAPARAAAPQPAYTPSPPQRMMPAGLTNDTGLTATMVPLTDAQRLQVQRANDENLYSSARARTYADPTDEQKAAIARRRQSNIDTFERTIGGRTPGVAIQPPPGVSDADWAASVNNPLNAGYKDYYEKAKAEAYADPTPPALTMIGAQSGMGYTGGTGLTAGSGGSGAGTAAGGGGTMAGGYAGLSGSVLGKLSDLGRTEQQKIDDQYKAAQGSALSSLVRSGLGNSSVLAAARRGLALDRAKAEVANRESVGNQLAGYETQIGLAGLQEGGVNSRFNTDQRNTMSRFGQSQAQQQSQFDASLGFNRQQAQASLAAQLGLAGLSAQERALGNTNQLGLAQLGFMNSVQAPYPDAGLYAQIGQNIADRDQANMQMMLSYQQAAADRAAAEKAQRYATAIGLSQLRPQQGPTTFGQSSPTGGYTPTNQPMVTPQQGAGGGGYNPSQGLSSMAQSYLNQPRQVQNPFGPGYIAPTGAYQPGLTGTLGGLYGDIGEALSGVGGGILSSLPGLGGLPAGGLGGGTGNAAGAQANAFGQAVGGILGGVGGASQLGGALGDLFAF